ncbi:MAG: DUF2288 domain-containing protein [Oligoflexus sp.]
MQQVKDLREKLLAELDELPWSELTRPFAAGRLYLVRQGIDIIDVAVAMAVNDAQTIASWMAENLFGRAEDEEVRHWLKEQSRFQVLIVSPFVLVQEKTPDTTQSDSMQNKLLDHGMKNK